MSVTAEEQRKHTSRLSDFLKPKRQCYSCCQSLPVRTVLERPEFPSLFPTPFLQYRCSKLPLCEQQWRKACPQAPVTTEKASKEPQGENSRALELSNSRRKLGVGLGHGDEAETYIQRRVCACVHMYMYIW